MSKSQQKRHQDQIPTLSPQILAYISTQELRYNPRGVEEILNSLRLNFSEGRLYQSGWSQAQEIENSIQIGLNKMEIYWFT